MNQQGGSLLNRTLTSSEFETRMAYFVTRGAPENDPIMLAFQGFAADRRPGKVNLSVGMYYDAAGQIPVLRAVAQAEAALLRRAAPWGYGMGEGLAAFRAAATKLLFGEALLARIGARLATIQTLGGTGALRLGAEMIRERHPGTQVALSRPSWMNHAPIFAAAGLMVTDYEYYDSSTGDVDVMAMQRSLASLPAGSVVVLHGCCHNPTGADLPASAWPAIASLMATRGLVAFLDVAYAGFGDGLAHDLAPARILAEAGVPLLVAMSCSKCFSLYGERVGLLAVLTGSAAEAAGLSEGMTAWTRSVYSTPPAHGAALVAEVLDTPELAAMWRAELEEMRQRIVATRAALVHRLASNAAAHDFTSLTRQKGIFSYTGLDSAQVERLKSDFAVHAVQDGRVCIAAVNQGNLDHVAEALRTVTQ